MPSFIINRDDDANDDYDYEVKYGLEENNIVMDYSNSQNLVQIEENRMDNCMDESGDESDDQWYKVSHNE
jgi:hypothetical protein